MKPAPAHRASSPAGPRRRRRSFPAALGISLLLAAVAAAMSFFVALFFAIIIFLIRGWSHGSLQSVDFTETYRLIALPVGLAGLVAGFLWSMYDSLRSRPASNLESGDDI